jgi:putative sterol carrier protein
LRKGRAPDNLGNGERNEKQRNWNKTKAGMFHAEPIQYPVGASSSMSGFKDDKHAYDTINGFLAELTKDDDKMLAGSGYVISFKLHNPDMHIVFDAREKPVPGCAYKYTIDAPNPPEPLAEFEMDAETFDKVYMGEAQAIGLLMTGKVKSRGNVTTAMRLLPVISRAIPRYKKYRETHG